MEAAPGPAPGQYTAYWIPAAPGEYHVSVALASGEDPGPVADACVSVAGAGASFPFTGADAVVVDEATFGDSSPGTTDLDLTFPALTLEAWVLFDAAPSADAYVAFKGSVEQIGSYAKGFELKYNAAAGRFYAAVYCGKGVIRGVDFGDAPPAGEWIHVAAVYDSARCGFGVLQSLGLLTETPLALFYSLATLAVFVCVGRLRGRRPRRGAVVDQGAGAAAQHVLPPAGDGLRAERRPRRRHPLAHRPHPRAPRRQHAVRALTSPVTSALTPAPAPITPAPTPITKLSKL
eukprot:1194381-Prorocentrum_minimum.AAC.3